MNQNEVLHKNRFLRNKRSFILLIILCMGVGFAYLTSSLTITGNTSVSGNKWNVYFTNVQVSDGSVDASVAPTTTGTNTTSIDYTVTLDKPGDFYEFTVDAVNDGTIDAIIDKIDRTLLDEEMSKIIQCSVTYLDGNDVREGDFLAVEDVATYKIRVEFKKDILPSDLSDNDTSLTLNFKVNYIPTKSRAITFAQSWNFDYTGTENSFYAPFDGNYKLEVWGAQGGSYSSTCNGGYGGYSTGDIQLLKNDVLYINVGGADVENGTHKAKAGGYNGGGNATSSNDRNILETAGGGATHIAVSSGLLKTFENKKDDLLIVAAGGGGGAGNSVVMCTQGGNAGGYIGNDGTRYEEGSTNGYGTGATQSSGGSYVIGSEINSKFIGTGNFGEGASTVAAGGGGGYYGGGVGIYSGGGGSGYIGNNSLSNKAMYCYNCEESNEKNTKTISTTDVSEIASSQKAKQGNGYAKIIFKRAGDILVEYLGKTSNSVDINNFDLDYRNGEISFNTSLNNTTEYAEFSFNLENSTDIDYYIKSIKKNNYDSSKIDFTILYMDETLIQNDDFFAAHKKEKLIVRVKLLDENYTLENEKFTFKIKFDRASDSSYYSRQLWNIKYTGKEEQFNVLSDGKYKIELWGAEGGKGYYSYANEEGGYGAYTSGIIDLKENDKLFIYVGGKGENSLNAKTVSKGGYNGGGDGGTSSDGDDAAGAGGGATDVRYFQTPPTEENLLWNSNLGLNSRIMVAAGGGGGHAGGNNTAEYKAGMMGGGLSITGGLSTWSNTWIPTVTQTEGYQFGVGVSNGKNVSACAPGGGGGGYYGGVMKIISSLSGRSSGGSSYISGHTGAVAITSATDRAPKEGCITGTSDNECSIHYSKKTFTNTKIIDGRGYGWTNTQNDIEIMPNPLGGNYESGTGNTGDGYARITYLGK